MAVNSDDGKLWLGTFFGVVYGPNYELTMDGQSTGDEFTAAFGGIWSADMTYDAQTGTLWQVNVGGDNCLHEWSPAGLQSTGQVICGPWPSSQRAVALNPVTDTFFVGGWNDEVVYEIDRSGTALATCEISLPIAGLAYNHQEDVLFVMTNAAPNLVHAVDPAACSIIETFEIGDGSFGDFDGAGLALDCNGDLLAPNQGDQNLYRIDSGLPSNLCGEPVPGAVLEAWATGFDVWGAGFQFDAGSLWLGSSPGGTYGPNDEFTVDGERTGAQFMPAFGGLWAADMTYDTSTGTFWQVNVSGDNCLYEWNPQTLVATGESICPDWPISQRGLTRDPVADTFLAGGWNEGTIYEIDRDGAIAGTCDLGLDISGLAYNHEAGLLYIMENSSDSHITMVDWPACSITGTLVPGGEALGPFAGAGLTLNCDGNLWTPNQQDDRAYLVHTGVPALLCGYQLAVQVGSGVGTVSPAQQTVPAGQDAGFIVAPGSGWLVDSVVGDTCSPVDNGDGSWTVAEVWEDCVVTVDFAPLDRIFHDGFEGG